jgi:hypothetical protein
MIFVKLGINVMPLEDTPANNFYFLQSVMMSHNSSVSIALRYTGWMIRVLGFSGLGIFTLPPEQL